MSMSAAARILGDINDGAVTILPDGRMTIPSDIAAGDIYRGIVRALIADRYAVRHPATGDVTLTGAGMADLAAEGVAL